MTTPDLAHRFDYHPPSTPGVGDTHAIVRRLIGELAGDLDNLLPEGREKALVMTHLEEAMFWGNAAIARSQHDGTA